MKRLPLSILLGVLVIAASCGLIFLTGPTPQPWATAMDIECWELLVQGYQGGDDTPTTISEDSGVILIKGALWQDGAGGITSGQDDSIKGRLILSGPATGQFGPDIMFYVSGAYDDTIDYFHMRTSNDNLFLGTNLDPDAFIMEADGTVDLTAGLKLAGTAMTATAAELNYLDGVTPGTAMASKALVLDAGMKIDTIRIEEDGLVVFNYAFNGSGRDLNVVDDMGINQGFAIAERALVLGADKDVDTLDIAKDGLEIDGVPVTTSADELNFNDGASTGVAVANKTVVLDASKDFTGIHDLTVDGDLVVGVNASINGELDVSTTATLNALVYKSRILSYSGDKSLDVSSGTITNKDASSSTTLTLLSAQAGLIYTFVDVEAAAGSDLWIKARSGDKINGGTAGKYYKCTGDAVKQHVTLECLDDTDWVVTAENGTWSNDNS